MSIQRRSDPRLPAYLVVGFTGLIGAIATGQHELAALGAPLLLLGSLALLDRVPRGLDGRVALATQRLIQGGEIEGEVHVDWDGVAEVDVMLTGARGVMAVDPAPVVGWSLPAGRGPAVLPFRLRATSWGVHDLGTLWLRARRPGGLLDGEVRLPLSDQLRVLPAPLRLNHLLKPAEPRAIAGMHLSRLRGHGTDLAELRPYQPGDRLRDLSWATSARLGSPWVTVHHPERTGTVLLVLDSFLTDELGSTEALARAARAAWAVASVHIGAQDRVGLLARGRALAWVPPQGGRRARLLLLDELLAVGGAAEAPWQRRHRSGRLMVPSDALVVGVSSLRTRDYTRALIHYKRTGHTTVCLVIDTSDLLPEAESRVDGAARRIWASQRAAERHVLDRSGIPTVLVSESRGVGPAISTLRRRMSTEKTSAVAR